MTYGREALEIKNYVKYLSKVNEVNKRFARNFSLSLALLLCLIFLFYGYALGLGSWLRVSEKKAYDGKLYSGGAIVGIMSAVITASFALAGSAQNMKVITEAKIAGKMAYDVIDAKPDVDPTLKGKKVEKDKMQGAISFKKVNFTYPTRTELQVLKDFTVEIEAGKTTALVGPSGSGKSTIVQLIERFYNPTSGDILVDGEKIDKYDLRSLR